jgi:hypothetical protein
MLSVLDARSLGADRTGAYLRVEIAVPENLYFFVQPHGARLERCLPRSSTIHSVRAWLEETTGVRYEIFAQGARNPLADKEPIGTQQTFVLHAHYVFPDTSRPYAPETKISTCVYEVFGTQSPLSVVFYRGRPYFHEDTLGSVPHEGGLSELRHYWRGEVRLPGGVGEIFHFPRETSVKEAKIQIAEKASDRFRGDLVLKRPRLDSRDPLPLPLGDDSLVQEWGVGEIITATDRRTRLISFVGPSDERFDLGIDLGGTVSEVLELPAVRQDSRHNL